MPANKPPIPLVRHFSLVLNPDKDSDKIDWVRYAGHSEPTDWEKLDKEYRVVVLAEAGAGKTHEMLTRAEHARTQGKMAFFIRIENLESGFENEFEVGNEDEFERWLKSDDEAWFYLDSIDEARLSSPKAFEKAIRCFAKRIKTGLQRAHTFVSSRPYAWRAHSDRQLLEEKLPYQQSTSHESEPISNKGLTTEEPTNDKPGSLKIYALDPLSQKSIRLFAQHRCAENLDRLMDALERSNLFSMAERPFDLDIILEKWRADKKLGRRLDMLQHSIKQQLGEIGIDRSVLQPLHLDTALQGARLIAATVSLTGEPGIRVPGSQTSDGIDASELFGPKWPDSDVRALLERGIFNDVLYGHVRFRHREIRDLLAAEWFQEQLVKGTSRRKIENLFFADQYGEKVIRPRLRSVLTWLILFDADIRQRAIAISPEIVTEGGDTACLPFIERKQILTAIVQRIADDRNNQDVQKHASITRIALPDLAETTLELIDKYKDNGEVIWFLGRLVWQGQMAACVPSLFGIAVDTNKKVHARVVSIHAVMRLGTQGQAIRLWQQLNALPDSLSPELLMGIIASSPQDILSVELLLDSIQNLPPYKQHNSEFSRLKVSINHMINRLPDCSSEQGSEPLLTLIDGINKLLERKPHLEGEDCSISEAYKWLLPAAAHAIERLVSSRSSNALDKQCLDTLIKISKVRYWRGIDESKYPKTLGTLISEWYELNDALFWFEVEQVRSSSNNPVTDCRFHNFYCDFYQFGSKRFFDVLDYVKSKPTPDDQLVALSLAYRVFENTERPDQWLQALHTITADSPVLTDALDKLIHPVMSESARLRSEQRAKEEENRTQEFIRKQISEEQQHREWVENLRSNPAQLEYLPDDPTSLTYNLIGLMHETDKSNNGSSRETYSNWQNLTPKFGEEVAKTYRDIAIKQWRRFTPELRSEGGDTNSWTYALMLGYAGLEIEFRETSEFIKNLSEPDAQHAARYWIQLLNRIPLWLESFHQAFPALVVDAVWKELKWELENTPAKESLHYVIDKLQSSAPWLLPSLSRQMFEWLKPNSLDNLNVLTQCISLTLSGDIDTGDYIDLIKRKISNTGSEETTAVWYALWLFFDADSCLPSITNYLESLPQQEASHQAQLVITHMFDARHSKDPESSKGELKPHQLKQLYLLMHHHIRKEDDINRAEAGAYSPGLRDHAQNSRNTLLHRLSNTAGKDSFLALTQLSHEHPVVSSRTWMRSLAYQRAEQDSDLDLMSARQVREFSESNTITPTSHKQLFDLTVNQLLDLKDWLEQGHDSPYKVWKKAVEETEVRNLIAGQLNQQSLGRYNCIQENELANGQRPDLLMTSIHVKSPVPVELKVLDKNWSGSKLCERLRNQLVGDYLREEEARCGVFLLVWQGQENRSYWEIENARVTLPNLQSALANYWSSISANYLGISNLEILVIDLTIREHKANS